MKFSKKVAIKIFEPVKQNKVLSAILFIALLLRFAGIYPGYHPYHSDEGMSYSSAIEMIRNLNIDPTRYDYPSLIPLINAFFYIIIFIPAFIIQHLIFDPELLPTKGRNLIELWQQVVIQNQQTAVLFWGRYVTAAFGAGMVFLTYLVAKRLFKERWISLVAAFLVAVNFRQVLNSHLGLPDIYNGFFLLLSIYIITLILKNPTKRNYFLGGIAAGLFFSTKFQIFVIPAFLLVHLKVSLQKLKKRKIIFLFKNFFSPGFLIACICAAAVVLLINPYHLLNWEKFLGVNSYTALKYTIGIKTLDFYPLLYLFHIGLGEFTTAAALLGILVALKKYTFNCLILLSISLPFFFVFVYYTGGGYYTRNFVTITPLLLIFAGIFIVELCGFLFKNSIVLKIAMFALVILISQDQIKNSVISSYYFSKPWGFKEAHDFAQMNMPNGARIVSHPWDKYPREMNFEIVPFESSEIFSLAEMREDGVDFGFLNMDWITLSSYWWMHMDRDTFLKFRGRPDDILANNYIAVAAQELASFSVATFIKPWQAPDMNFLIVKIPKNEPPEKIEKLSFSFDDMNNFSAWRKVSVVGDGKNIIFDPKAGKETPGSLKIEAGIARYPVFMAKSPAIKIADKHSYFIEGWIKTSTRLTKKERDGFLRVDFYSDEPSFNLEDKILYGGVSSRIFGEPVWIKKEMLIFPPNGAKFMTIGLQVNNYGEFWFDDIKVYESVKEVKNPRKSPPYLDYRIPYDILFPYSQGGL